MPIYVIYEGPGEASMFEAMSERTRQQEYLLTHTVYDRPMKLIATFYAKNWKQAKEAELAILFPED